MVTEGTWSGWYKYNNRIHHQLKGVEATNFEIKITAADNESFVGTVQDDLLTGGTEGVGEIIGTCKGNNIEFVKQMPVMTLLDSSTGERKTFNKKHRQIFYTGTFSDEGKTVSGRWKFKAGFVLVGLMLIFGKSNSGTWSMTMKEPYA